MADFLFVPKENGGIPLYEQIYRYVVEEIRSGRLEEGDKLPSKRALCAHLGVSQSTVEGAYGLLVAEGYVRSLPRSGYWVCAVAAPEVPVPRQARCSAPKLAGKESHLSDCFSTAAVDTSVFPYATWARLMRRAVQEPALLQRGHTQGDLDLREALCAFLHQYRGVNCRPEQVVVGAGMEYLMDILLQLLPGGGPIGLENPGYRAVYRSVENLRRPFVPVALDSQGLSVDVLEQSGAEAVYVTPSHQFPMGVTMPAPRRSALLRWAYSGPHRYIVEDDYDSEFRYTSRPIPAMQGADKGGRVIYTGTFSRSIAPSIRAAYLIVPEGLLPNYQKKFAHGAATVSRFEQWVLAEFLSSGQYARHLRRVGGLYRVRCAALTSALERTFPGGRVSGNDAGLHLLLTLPGREEKDLAAAAVRAGYRIHTLGEYCHGPSSLPGTLVLGFAGLEAEKAAEAAQELRRAIEE
jgi:GntR family transcriptional regulator/MocR family aminotransferase